MTRYGQGKIFGQRVTAEEFRKTLRRGLSRKAPIVVTRRKTLIYGWDQIRELADAGYPNAEVYIVDAEEDEAGALRDDMIEMFGPDGAPDCA